MRRAILTSALIVSLVPLAAQQPAPSPTTRTDQPTFRAGTSLVMVDAVVTDRDGHQVRDLTAADFEIVQRGKPQPLRQVVYVPLRSAHLRAPVAGAQPPAAGSPAPLPEDAQPSTIARRPAAAPVNPLRAVRPDVRRTVAIVVDDLGLSFENMARLRTGLKTFVDDQVQPGDLVAVLRTSGGVGALQQFTTDKRLLDSAVDRLQWTVLSRAGVTSFEPVTMSPVEAAFESGKYDDPDHPDPARDRSLRDRPAGVVTRENTMEGARENVVATASLNALEYVVRGVERLPGRKAVVFVSEGFELFNRSGQANIWSAFTRVMDRANRAGVVVYTVDGRGLEAYGLTAEDAPQVPCVGRCNAAEAQEKFEKIVNGAAAVRKATIRNSEEALTYMAQQTGGLAILNSNDVPGTLRKVFEDLNGYYLLGYEAPDNTPRSWDPGTVTVRAKRPGLTVRARQGFFGPADPVRPPQPSGDSLTLAALSPFEASDIPVRLTSVFAHSEALGLYIRSLLFIDANELQFGPVTPDGRHEASVELVQLAVGDNGEILGNFRRTLSFALTDAQLADTKQRGIVYNTRMTVRRPGPYQVRTALRDTHTGRLGSASQFIQVPEVGKGRLAVSGVLLTNHAANTKPGDTARSAFDAPDAGVVLDETLGKPSVRIFDPGTDVLYAYEIYDGVRDGKAGFSLSATVLCDGRSVYTSPSAPGSPAPSKEKIRVVPVAGVLNLGTDMPPGHYSLEVTVRSGKRVARQYADFEVRDPHLAAAAR